MKWFTVFLAGSTALATTITVSRSGPVASIQQAISQAAPGDVIRVQSGLYSGNIVLNRSVTLEGVGRPVVRGNGRGSVVTITAPGCTVRGFTIENSGPMLVDEDSGILLRSGGNHIENNELRDVLFGIYFYRSNDNVISGNVIRGRTQLEPGERGSAIHIWDSLRNTITDNTITGARDGMYLQNASNSVIVNNRISNLRYGLHYMFSDDNRFEDNVFFDNVAGAAIMYSQRIDFRRNSFVRNRGFSSFGILFQDSRYCVAEDNDFSDNATGIFMEALRDSVFRRNTIAANDVAIQAFSSASGITFAGNNFVENLSPLQLIGKELDTRWMEGGSGNYWSGYDGYDLDANGIGDLPFRIQNAFEHLEGNFPRVRLYLFSPAAQALALSDRMFPVIAGPSISDPAPLMKPLPLVRRDVTTRRGSGYSASVVAASGLIGLSASIAALGRRKLWSKSVV